MSDKNRTTTTPHQVRGKLWQDDHSGLRRHKLMTKEIGATIPPLYANDGADDPDAVVARVKLFSPYSNGPGTSPSGTPRPERASASSKGLKSNWATST